jgi:hypothetical protein
MLYMFLVSLVVILIIRILYIINEMCQYLEDLQVLLSFVCVCVRAMDEMSLMQGKLSTSSTYWTFFK